MSFSGSSSTRPVLTRHVFHGGLLLTAMLALLTPLFCGDAMAEPGEKSAIPKQPAQAKADHELRERYKADFLKRTAEDRLALAAKLRDLAAHENDPAMRFVMLRDARDLYIDGGDLDSSLAVVDEISAAYAVDGRDMQLAAMSMAVDTSPAAPPDMVGEYLKLTERFLEAGDADLAEHSCRLAQNVIHNHRLRDPELVDRVKDEHRSVMISLKETQAVVGAMRKLKADPEDPEANLAVGRYACFFRGLWTQNLSMLTKGSDSRLKMLADEELKPPATSDEMLSLADGWWSAADAASTPVARRKVRRHAAEWYGKAVSGLQGERKRTAQQRIAEAGNH